MTCLHCKAENTKTSLFCVACGYALCAYDEIECENHPGTNATGVCVICGKPVCDDCSVAREKKVYCADAAHTQLITAYTKLWTVENEFGADIIIKNLSTNGVSSLHYSPKRFSQFCHLTDDCSVSVFVRTEMIDEAQRLLKEMDLKDFLIHETIHL